MSLIKCEECGKEISDKADKCPNCGCPVEKLESNTDNIYENFNAQKAKWSSGKLAIGIISEVLFFVIAFQSCAAGAYNALSSNSDSSGTTGIICALLMAIAGIIGMVTRNSIKKTGSTICVVIYWLSFLFANISGGVFADLKIWGFILFAFGIFHLLSMMHSAKTIVISCICSLFFCLLVSAMGESEPEDNAIVIKENKKNVNAQAENADDKFINGEKELETQASSEKVTSDDSIDSINFSTDEYSIEYTGYDIGGDYEGNDCIIIYYNFTNNSQDNTSALVKAYIQVFQDGVACDTTMLPFDISLEAVSNYSKNIQSGYTINVAQVYKINSDNDITIEASEAFSWDETKDTMILKIKN